MNQVDAYVLVKLKLNLGFLIYLVACPSALGRGYRRYHTSLWFLFYLSADMILVNAQFFVIC